MSYTVLTGGARSGKSGLAVRRAERYAENHRVPTVFVATAEAGDDEMARRISLHQAERAERAATWRTIEEPVDVQHAVAGAAPQAALVIDCLALWVSNLMARDETEPAIIARAQALATALAERPGPAWVVTNEVGSGIVPMGALARQYRDVLGRVNVTVAAPAQLVQLVVAGCTLTLHPEPEA